MDTKKTRTLEPVVGLETHVQLLTRTKMFCGCSTRFGAPANTQTCPVCLGLPGSLPVLNARALEEALKVAMALGAEIAPQMKFDRKNYFYPDLPKNFQISQFDQPLAQHGTLEYASAGALRRVRIKRIHLEEDAGKLIHEPAQRRSLVDLNRAGTPLIEIVTEPDLTSPQDAYDYLTALKSILEYLEVSDCNMEEGSLRCDANLSLRPVGSGPRTLGVKVELKNMNSFRGVKNALTYEVERQTQVLQDGGSLRQETRQWVETQGRTQAMRSKEDAHDYRYFPEPDLPLFVIGTDQTAPLRAALPELPSAKRSRLVSQYKLSEYEASVLTGSKAMADYFEQVVKDNPRVISKQAASWLMGEYSERLNALGQSPKDIPISSASTAQVIVMTTRGTLSRPMARKIVDELWKSPHISVEAIVEAHGLTQVQDRGTLQTIVDRVIHENQKSAADYRSGKKQALVFLVGQVMKQTSGKADPKLTNQLLQEALGPPGAGEAS